jgi:hypothetical protein
MKVIGEFFAFSLYLLRPLFMIVVAICSLILPVIVASLTGLDDGTWKSNLLAVISLFWLLIICFLALKYYSNDKPFLEK